MSNFGIQRKLSNGRNWRQGMCLTHSYRGDPHYVPPLHFPFYYGEVIVFWGANYLQMSTAKEHVLWFIWRGGNNVCYMSRKSSPFTSLNVPLFPYYAHADKNSWLAITTTPISSPALINEPTTHLVVSASIMLEARTHIFLYILKAGILSCTTVNDIRRKPNSRKPYVISQCMSSVPKPRPRYLAFNAIPTVASRSGGGLKLRLMCPKNSCLSLSSTTRKKMEPSAVDSIVLCRNCAVRVGERSSTKDNRWTTGSPQRSRNSRSSVGAYGRRMVRLVSHREYGEVGTFMQRESRKRPRNLRSRLFFAKTQSAFISSE